jgi:hypothetical protein
MLFGKNRRVDLLNSRKIIDSIRLLPFSPKVRKVDLEPKDQLLDQWGERWLIPPL